MNRWMRFGVIIGLLALGLLPGGVPRARADSGARTYDFLIASDFLCGLEPSACPAIAMAENGDTVEITGAGTFTIHPDTVHGGGSFAHKDAAGHVLFTGTWTAVEVLSFHSYGSGAVQGLPQEFEGGQLMLRVLMDPGEPGGARFPAILWVHCLLGDKIPQGSEEGIRLNVPGVLNFQQTVSGFTLFIRH
jgi:hypothetical protein